MPSFGSMPAGMASAPPVFQKEELMSDSMDMSLEEELESLAALESCDDKLMAFPEVKITEPIKINLDFNWLLSQQSASGMFKFAPTDTRFSNYCAKNINSEVEGK